MIKKLLKLLSVVVAAVKDGIARRDAYRRKRNFYI